MEGDRSQPVIRAGSRTDAGREVWGWYLLHQVPGWIAVGAAGAVAAYYQWIAPAWAIGFFALVVVKDLAMYPWMRAAYGPARLNGAEALVAQRARVETPLDPVGRVRLGPEIWRARCERSAARIERGEVVVVRAVRGLELRVERAGGADPDPG